MEQLPSISNELPDRTRIVKKSDDERRDDREPQRDEGPRELDSITCQTIDCHNPAVFPCSYCKEKPTPDHIRDPRQWAWYCSEVCRQADWTVHKLVCNFLIKRDDVKAVAELVTQIWPIFRKYAFDKPLTSIRYVEPDGTVHGDNTNMPHHAPDQYNVRRFPDGVAALVFPGKAESDVQIVEKSVLLYGTDDEAIASMTPMLLELFKNDIQWLKQYRVRVVNRLIQPRWAHDNPNAAYEGSEDGDPTSGETPDGDADDGDEIDGIAKNEDAEMGHPKDQEAKKKAAADDVVYEHRVWMVRIDGVNWMIDPTAAQFGLPHVYQGWDEFLQNPCITQPEEVDSFYDANDFYDAQHEGTLPIKDWATYRIEEERSASHFWILFFDYMKRDGYPDLQCFQAMDDVARAAFTRTVEKCIKEYFDKWYPKYQMHLTSFRKEVLLAKVQNTLVSGRANRGKKLEVRVTRSAT